MLFDGGVASIPGILSIFIIMLYSKNLGRIIHLLIRHGPQIKQNIREKHIHEDSIVIAYPYMFSLRSVLYQSEKCK
jgi:hypothetical protein